MKKLVALILLLACSIAMFAEKINLNSNYHGYEITTNNSSILELDYSVSDLVTEDVQTENGMFTKLFIPGGHQTKKAGEPALPTFNSLIEMPYGSKPEVEIVSFEVKEYQSSDLGLNHEIYPAQPSYAKNTKPEDIKFIFNKEAYEMDSFKGQELVKITKQGTMRGVDVATIIVNPVQYNPVSGIIKVYENIKVKINYNSSDAFSKKSQEYSPFFKGAFDSFINHKEVKSDVVNYPVSYLIVANEDLQENSKLQEFIDWKTEKGFNVVEHYVSSSATVSEIDSWIEGQYNSMTVKPSFVLLVGDMDGTYTVATETSNTSGTQASDLQYGVMSTVSSGNHVPSMYVGRFSVRSLDELTAQVDKTIWYEKGQFLDAKFDKSYLGKAQGVAGADASYQANYGNPHIRYQMEHYYNNADFEYPQYNETPVLEGTPFYDGATGQSGTIVANMSEGRAIYNYTAHGSPTSFGDPSFTINDINSLSNNGKYGLVVGNCCLTGTFNNSECFGEAWLNVADKGAVGYIGASESTYWDEDLAMGVGNDTSGDMLPPFSPNEPGMFDGLFQQTHATQGGMKHVALLAVDRSGSSRIMYYWNAYHVFGDPSVMIYAGVPTANSVDYGGVMQAGADSYQINTAPGSYVAISDESGSLKAVALANGSGVATLEPAEPLQSGLHKLVVTAQFKEPYFEDVDVAIAAGPYLTIDGDLTVENAEYGETGTITAVLKNAGVDEATNITVTASTTNTNITFTDAEANLANLAADGTVNLTDEFTFTVANGATDQEIVPVTFTIEDSYSEKKIYESNKTFVVNAPDAKIAVEMSGNGSPDPGETREITYTISNNGHADITNAVVTLSETDNIGVTISAAQNFATINSGSSVEAVFTVEFANDIELGTQANFNLSLEADKDYSAEKQDTFIVGYSEITEDFEGTWPPQNWEIVNDANNKGWFKGSETYEGSGCAGCAYDHTESVTLTMPSILLNNSSANLSFMWKDDDINAKVANHDTTYVEISTDEGNNWDELGFLSKNLHESSYNEFSVSLADYYTEGQAVIIRWRDSSDGTSSAWGVGIDNVKITNAEFGESIADEEEPIVSNVSGLTGSVGEDLTISLEASDNTGIASIIGKATINEVTSDIQMTITTKTIKTRNGIKVVSAYTGTIPAQNEAVVGSIFFETTDTCDPANTGNSAEYTIEWIAAPIITEDFENDVFPPAGWQVKDIDDDGFNWQEGVSPGIATYSGEKSAASASYDNEGQTALTPDNWLILPAVSNPQYLRYYVCAQDAAWAGEKYGVYVSTTDTETASFTEIFSETMTAKETGSWYERTIDLSDYVDEGKVYVALRHFDCTDNYMIVFDNVQIWAETVLDIEDNNLETVDWKLEQNYPNPFNPATSISFSVKEAGMVKLAVYNSNGQLVKNLVNNNLKAGHYNAKFNAENLNSGVYFYQLKAGSKIMTRKMILVK